MDTFDVKNCRTKLAEHYQKTAKVPITAWSSITQVDLEQIYTRLSWVKEEQTTAGSSQRELSHYTELFTEKTKSGAVPKRILVQGETGIGKTTFVKKLLVDWSNLVGAKVKDAEKQEDELNKCGDRVTLIKHSEDGVNLEKAKMEEERKDALREFELLVSINLKEVSKCETLREVIRCSRLFPEDDLTSVDELLSYIDKNQEKVLIVLDGYDEYRTGSEAEEKYGSGTNSPIYKVFYGNVLRYCTVLVTTRSSRADEIRGPADIQAEITGFNVSDRKDFMRKMLESETQVDDLLGFLKESKMEDLARVPLLTLFFCLLWREEKKSMEFTESKTKLFRAIMKHILQHSQRKHSPHISKLKEENYPEILAAVGKVALAGLLKGDLVFEFGQLPEEVRSEDSVIVGLLQLSEYGSLEPVEMVSFIHKSIQEYLAAWYINYRCVPEGSLGGIEQHARTLENCKALENVFQFICGLSDDEAVMVFQHFASVRISDQTLDLSKTIPDVENEAGVPLCHVTDRHESFSGLVDECFREVHSKPELLSNFVDCTGGIVLATRHRPLCELMPQVDDLTERVQNCVFLFDFISFDDDGEGSVMYKSLEFLNCLQMPLTIPGRSKVVTVEDLVRKVQIRHSPCFFSFILCLRNGQFQCYITNLFLNCDHHARLFTESTMDSVPSVSASFCSEQSCLKFLNSLHCYNLSGQTVKALGAVIQSCKQLSKIQVEESGDDICDLLEQVPNPRKCSLSIGPSTKGPDIGVRLTSAATVKLSCLLPRFKNIIVLDLDLNECRSVAVDKLVTSITHTTLERLVLSGISLTSQAAAALGRLLPELSSMLDLELTGVCKGILQAEEVEKLFGGFNKTLPLSKLTFCDFNVGGCLAPLTRSFCFFPSLTELNLERLNMDEHDLCGLLENVRFIRSVTALSIQWSTDEKQTTATLYDGKLKLAGISLTPVVAEVLVRSLPEMSSLQTLKLTGGERIVQAKETEALFGRYEKAMPLQKLILTGSSARGCLNPLTKSFRFFPYLRELYLGDVNMDGHHLCGLLESLRFMPKLKTLSVWRGLLNQAHRCTTEVNTITSITHDTLEQLNLDGISLNQAAAAVLGRSLPQMSSLHTLELTGVNESALQAEGIEMLFGGFNKALPLQCLTFRGFGVKGCLAPVTKSFRFFPNLRELNLGGLNGEINMNEHNLCVLLESLRFMPNLKKLRVRGKPLSQAHCCTVDVNTAVASITHKTLVQLNLDGLSLTPKVAAMLGRSLPEMLSLQVLELIGVNESIVQAKEMEALFGGFNKTLPLYKIRFKCFSVRGCLAPLAKSLCFFPSLGNLNLSQLNIDERDVCSLLECLRFITNLRTLSVRAGYQADTLCYTTESPEGYPPQLHKTLNLNGITLTPAVAAALGRSLPEMSSLETLELTGVNGSSLQTNEMEALFGGFSKTLPLTKLTLSGFNVTGCLAPLIKSLQFFPSLARLDLKELNKDERDLSELLANFRFVPDLSMLNLSHNPLGHAVRSIVPHISNLQKLQFLWIENTSYSGEDLNYVRGALQQALPKLIIRSDNYVFAPVCQISEDKHY